LLQLTRHQIRYRFLILLGLVTLSWGIISSVPDAPCVRDSNENPFCGILSASAGYYRKKIAVPARAGSDGNSPAPFRQSADWGTP